MAISVAPLDGYLKTKSFAETVLASKNDFENWKFLIFDSFLSRSLTKCSGDIWLAHL